MMTAKILAEMADKIDHRLGPIPGRDADALAVALRWAATQIAGLKHPTGSAAFGAQLDRLGVPAPWALCDEEVGEILAMDKSVVLAVHARNPSEVAAWIVCAVNTLAGWRALL